MTLRRRLALVFVFGLSLFCILVDYLKHDGTLSQFIPQTKAWDTVNLILFPAEGFLAYNVGNLLPWHAWGILGLLLIVVLGVLVAQRDVHVRERARLRGKE